MTDPLLRRPFDHYARYRLAAEVIEAVGARTILDVGGGPGSLASFCPERQVVATDLNPPGRWHAAAPALVVADGVQLPFAEDSFQCVVTLDTLEHVAQDKRAALLDEAVRVAREWVLVVCPCATPGVADADEALLSIVRRRFGDEFPTVDVLTEHLAYGHPDPAEIASRLDTTAAQVERFPSGCLDRWLPMMLVFFDLLALGEDEPVERVQAWYNARFYREDLRDPAYRQAFLAKLDVADGPTPADVVDRLTPGDSAAPPPAEAFHTLQIVLQEELAPLLRDAQAQRAAAQDSLAAARAEAEGHAARAETAERRAALVEERATAAEQRVAELEAFRQDVLAHPAVRARRWLRSLGGRVRARARPD